MSVDTTGNTGMTLEALFDQAERGVEHTETWTPSDDDPKRVGLVETWKLVTPRARPGEPVWIIEARDREARLWSLFVSAAALQSKLMGTRFANFAEVAAADPTTFLAKVGDIVCAISYQGKHPHTSEPGKTVTRWGVKVIEASTLSTDGPDQRPTFQPSGGDGDIPFRPTIDGVL